MAFEFGRSNVELPTSLSGTYLIPYSWMEYGFRNEYLKVHNRKFFETVQGSVYMEALENHIPTCLDRNGKRYDIWLVYKTNSGKVDPIFIESGTVNMIEDDHYKLPIIVGRWEEFVNTPNNSKTFNNATIQLLKGCGVRLVYSVWTPIFE